MLSVIFKVESPAKTLLRYISEVLLRLERTGEHRKFCELYIYVNHILSKNEHVFSVFTGPNSISTHRHSLLKL
jgi:hypothetical protein